MLKLCSSIIHCILVGHNMPSVLWRCWLGGRKGILPVKNWVVRYWHGYLFGERSKWFAYAPAGATATPSSLTPVKSRMVYLSGAGLPRLSSKKPLNGCSSSNTICSSSYIMHYLITYLLHHRSVHKCTQPFTHSQKDLIGTSQVKLSSWLPHDPAE